MIQLYVQSLFQIRIKRKCHAQLFIGVPSQSKAFQYYRIVQSACHMGGYLGIIVDDLKRLALFLQNLTKGNTCQSQTNYQKIYHGTKIEKRRTKKCSVFIL